jgi:hypothetical protein
MLTLKGRLKVKKEEQVINDRFKKREFVITDEGSQYPQDILFQLTQDRTSLLDQFNEGDELNVFFNLRGREWTSPTGEIKYFNTLDAWKIETGAAAAAAAPEASFEAPGDEDLPF